MDDLVPTPADNWFEHEEAEALHLLKSNRRWHGELLPTHDGFDQSRSIMLESLRNHRSNLLRCFGPEPKETRGLRHLCEIWVVQVRSKIENAGGLHFQLNKSQRPVVEDNHLDRQLQLPKREQIAHKHCETTVSGQREHLPTRMTDLRANGLWQGIRHGPMVKGAEEPPFAVHSQVTGCPNRRGADIAGENRVFGGKLVEHSDHILRMDRFLTRFTCREFI